MGSVPSPRSLRMSFRVLEIEPPSPDTLSLEVTLTREKIEKRAEHKNRGPELRGPWKLDSTLKSGRSGPRPNGYISDMETPLPQ